MYSKIVSSIFLVFTLLHVINCKCNCGMKGDSGNITSRIIGGRPTKSHPWQVSLSLGPGIALCGGTIISKYHVLTAAHCVVRGENKTLKPQQITVRVGSSFLKGGKVFNVSKIFTNGYKDNCTTKQGCIEVKNDIAILKLKCPVKFGPTIQPVCLPSNETEYPYPNGTWAIATGFGKTSSNGTKSNTLMEVVLKISKKPTDWPGFIYTHTPKKGTCHGDSGGPLMIVKNVGIGVKVNYR